MKELPIRVRLSLWYFAMFATAACLLSTASWWMLRRSVDTTEYNDLESTLATLKSQSSFLSNALGQQSSSFGSLGGSSTSSGG